MAFSLGINDVGNIKRILKQLLQRSESQGCMVCDFSGYVLAHEGISCTDPMLISALGAGVFAASRELARILGENEFSAVTHTGEKRSLFICAVNQDVLMVDIFSNAANMGLVKLYAKPAVADLRAQFADISKRGDLQESEEQTFVINEGKDWFDPNQENKQ